MIIERLKLVNYIGIFSGLSKTEIEIDFTTDENGKKIDNLPRIFMFNGKNGSGKSTIMSQLHPFRDSFDNRTELILDGENGLKEIDIRNGEDFYEIIHQMKKYGAKSFIKKNGEELNPNGGIKTFNEIVSEELGIERDFNKLAKMGSNIQGFVDLSTADRKKYISKFIPNFDDYLEAFEIVKNKYRSFDSKIKFIASELKTLDDIGIVQSEITKVNNEVNSIKKELESLQRQYGQQTSLIENLEKDNDFGSAQDIQLKIITEKKNLSNMKIFVLDFNEKYGENPTVKELENSVNNFNVSLTKLDGEISLLELKITQFREKCINYRNDIVKAKNKLDQYINNGTLVSLLQEEKELIENQNKITDKINTSIFKDVSLKKQEMSKELSKYIDNIDNFIYYLKSSYSVLIDKDIFEESNINIFEKNINIRDDIIKLEKIKLVNSETDIQDIINVLEKEYMDKSQYINCAEKLKLRPVDCKIDTCPFLIEAIEHRNTEIELKTIKDKISLLKKDAINIDKKQVKLSDLTYEFKLYQDFRNKLNADKSEILIIFLNQFNNDIVKLIKENSLIDISKLFYKFKDDSSEYLNNINKLDDINNRLNVLKPTIKNLKDNQEIIDELNLTISSNETKVKNLEKEILGNEDHLNKVNSNKSLLDLKKIDYTKFLESKKTYNDLKVLIDALEGQFDTITKNENVYKKLKEESGKTLETISFNNDLLKNRESSLNILNIKEGKILEYTEKKKDIENDFIDLKYIKTALDPIKGIPIYFMQDYLNRTEAITNRLLDLAFDGKFHISFELTATDFNIKVNDEGITKEDISQASQGELALTTISLSLALLEQSIKKFNIVTLDEIDGALDDNNRNTFIDILNTQMDSLGVEQLFIISHNRAFDNKELNLILLKGNNVDSEDESFMKNKNIIYNYGS